MEASYEVTAHCVLCDAPLVAGEEHPPCWGRLLMQGPGTTRMVAGRRRLKPAFQWVRPEDNIPAIYAQERHEGALAVVKLFTPDSSWTWYVVEHDAQGGDACFGLVDGHKCEAGYFSLRELAEARGPMGLCIERDLYWTPKPWREIQAESARG